MPVSKEIVERVRILCPIIALLTTAMATHSDAADFDGHSTQRGPSRTRVAPCPIDEVAFNDTGPETARCVCAPGGDIRCHGGVRAVPKLVVGHLRHAQGTSFAGFYAARQDIGGVPAFAFADLSVDRIVLNFNPIGQRQARFIFRTTFKRLIIPVKAREYVFTGVGCCLPVTTITKKIVDGFVPNFIRRFLWESEDQVRVSL